MSKEKPYKLKVLDFRSQVMTDDAALQILHEVAAGVQDQIQCRCDSQGMCNVIRAKLMRHAMADGRQFEMAILGSGAAVGVKMHMPAQYIWDPVTRRDIPREQWVKDHPGTA